MIVRPRREDHLVIGYYTGKIIVGVGLLMVVPLVVSAVFGEWDTATDFIISLSVCVLFGIGAQLLCTTTRDPSWSHGLVVAAGSWLWATAFGALPHYLSGHMGSYLDACFDVMSGFTTTGLYLLQDLDHISNGLNMWRHLITYAGGQGIVVIALTFMVKGTAGAYKLYVGEGKDAQLMPNVVQTARAIWLVSLVYLVLGTLAFALLGLFLGQGTVRSILHGMWVFMGGWSTGGFAPQSYNTMYFHSLSYEVLGFIVFTVGSFNFALHWAVWSGNRREIYRNIETVSFAATLTATVLVATFWLARQGFYADTVILFRKAFYQIISGHTTTGWSTIYARSFVTQWGPVGMLATIVAMSIGASSASTAGGIKALRVGIIVKSFASEIRKLISPESAVIREKFHHIGTRWLTEPLVKGAMTITLAYVVMYAVTTVVGVLYGYDLIEALFEGVSVASNTGLSCGVTAPDMPTAMKWLFLLDMWLGRLEFMSVLAVFGYLIAAVKGR